MRCVTFFIHVFAQKLFNVSLPFPLYLCIPLSIRNKSADLCSVSILRAYSGFCLKTPTIFCISLKISLRISLNEAETLLPMSIVEKCTTKVLRGGMDTTWVNEDWIRFCPFQQSPRCGRFTGKSNLHRLLVPGCTLIFGAEVDCCIFESHSCSRCHSCYSWVTRSNRVLSDFWGKLALVPKVKAEHRRDVELGNRPLEKWVSVPRGRRNWETPDWRIECWTEGRYLEMCYPPILISFWFRSHGFVVALTCFSRRNRRWRAEFAWVTNRSSPPSGFLTNCACALVRKFGWVARKP